MLRIPTRSSLCHVCESHAPVAVLSLRLFSFDFHDPVLTLAAIRTRHHEQPMLHI
jgi:hypothetical protein